MSDNWVLNLPIAPLSVFVEHHLKFADETFGKMPTPGGDPALLSEYYAHMHDGIKQTNIEIRNAKTRDDVTAAQARRDNLQNEIDKIHKKFSAISIEGLLQKKFACVGHLNGERIVVPAKAWSGKMDWDEEILSFNGQEYTQLRAIIISNLDDLQRERVLKSLDGDMDAKPGATGTPGRPSSMHIIETEFQRRAAEDSLASSLAAEASFLTAWFKQKYPDYPPITPKTIENRLRAQFREAKQKAA